MNRKKVTALAIVAMSGLAGVGLAVSGTAHAGVNGQQLRVCSTGDFQTVTLDGPDPNGKKQFASSPFTGEGKVKCTLIPNFYWAGTVEVGLTGLEVNSVYEDCEVPKELLTGDIFECHIEPEFVTPPPEEGEDPEDPGVE